MISTKPTDEYFKYIDIESIDNKLHKIKEPKIIQSNIAPSRATRQLSTGDTLFSMVRPYLENIAFVDESNADCIASTGFYVCKPNIFLESKYCYHLMTSLYVITGLNHYMKGDNSPSINNDNILNWLYPIPPLNEQKRIVTAIEEYQNIIEELNFNKEKLQIAIKQTKSKILDLAIRGKLVPQDPNDEPASVLLERIKSQYSESNKKAQKTRDNSHYENLEWNMPSNWCWCQLSDICDFERGITFPSSAKTTYKEGNLLPCIRTANVQEELELEGLWYIDPIYIKNNKEKLVRNGDIIMSSANSRELVGKTSYVQDIEYDMTFGGFVLNIRAKGIETKYLFYLLRCYFEKGIFMEESTQTTNIANINATVLGNLKIPLPPVKEQIRITSQIALILKKLENIMTEL